MNWFTRSCQRCLGLLAVVALLLLLALSACGAPASAANSSAPVNTRPQQNQPATSGSTTHNTGNSGVQNTDQQIQSLLQQLDGAQKDASNADAGASQDGGQP